MNDDRNLQDQQGAAPRPVVVRDELQPVVDNALPRPVAVDGGALDDGGKARPALPQHDDGLRPGAAGHGQDAETVPEMRQAEPNDGTRPGAVSAAADGGANAAGREHVVPKLENGGDDREARPVTTDHDELAASDSEPDVSEPTFNKTEPAAEADPVVSELDNKAAPEAVPPVAPPASADLVTVEDAVAIFAQRGLPRHMRTIQKYCSRKSGRALVCYQVPTENGIRYMIERSSIDRFIADAAQQAPTGKLEPEPVAATVEREVAPAAAPDISDIFEHPFVQRLEAQVERLESRNENLTREIQNVLTQANERLVELQKANAVAQSESLGTFLLEAERIRRRQEAPNDVSEAPLAATSPVNREGRQFGTFDV